MASSPSLPDSVHTRSESIRPLLIFSVLLLLARVVYLKFFCGYHLIEDEAQYWVWAKNLEWSYYSKGPGVAWTIALSTKVFGDAPWAVRLPTAVLTTFGALAAGMLVRDLARYARHAESRVSPSAAGLVASMAFALTPALQLAGVLMTIDGPYVAMWAACAWSFWRAHVLRQRPFWVLVGLFLGLGFLFKYTMLLLVPGLILFAIIGCRSKEENRQPSHDRTITAIWFVLGLAIAVLSFAPVFIWNSQHNWVTIKHLLGHLGVSGGDVPVSSTSEKSQWSPWWSLELVGQQLAIVGPWLVLAIGSSIRSWRLRKISQHTTKEMARLYLFVCAVPVLVFYLIVSLVAEPEGNWPMAAYATLMPLAGWVGLEATLLLKNSHALELSTRIGILWRRRLFRWGLAYCLIALIPLHVLDHFADLALWIGRQPIPHQLLVKLYGRELRDPAGRLRGAQEMAQHVHELVDELEARTGKNPFVMAQHYGRASQMMYYLDVQEHRADIPVVSAMVYSGGRASQFDLWEFTSLGRGDLPGRPCVILSSTQPWLVDLWKKLFVSVEPLCPEDPPSCKLRGENKPDRSAFLGFEYTPPFDPRKTLP